jgi:myo-inositol-1(or 4)-monophosphatase
MKISQSELIQLKSNIHDIVKHLYEMKDSSFARGVEQKQHLSLVTSIDYAISNLFEDFCDRKKIALISEENSNRVHDYPVAILDPIDGTRELVEGLPECSVSFSVFYGSTQDPRNFSWIYNPFTGFEISSQQLFISSRKRRETRLMGLVSNSEFGEGLYERINLDSLDLISPRGSIAFKLGLLATGACDFVVSFRGKNIWDVLAGTHICSQRGISFYVNGCEFTDFHETRIEEGVLIWCPENYRERLAEVFLSETP